MINLSPTGIITKFYKRINFAPPSNLCSLVWCTLAWMALGIGIGVFVGTAPLGWLYMFWGVQHWSIVPGILSLAMMSATGIVAAVVWADDKSFSIPGTDIICTVYKGFKERYCPLVSYVNPPRKS